MSDPSANFHHDLMPQLDGYQVRGVLGQGGMGTVFHAEQVVLGREVAIKVLNRDMTRNERQLERFLQEARVVARMGCHAHIVQVHDVVRDARGSYCIVMEFVEGRSLAQVLRAGERPSLADTIKIAVQVCDALSIAHARGVIHRDIKPENIMISSEGRVKVTDFGIARAEGAVVRTQTGEILGTPHYMAPEQVRGDGTADARSDLYSLCVVLYYLASGELPFDDTNPYSIAFKHTNDPVTPPSNFEPSLPKPLEALILKGLEKKQADRFQTAEELRNELEAITARGQVATIAEGGGTHDSNAALRRMGAGRTPYPGHSSEVNVPPGHTMATLSTKPTPGFRAVVETDPATGTRYRFDLSPRAVTIVGVLLIAMLGALYWMGRSTAGDPKQVAGGGDFSAASPIGASTDGRRAPTPTPLADLPDDARPTLAVFPFAVDGEGLTEADGRTIANLLTRQFSADRYRLIDQGQVGRLVPDMAEQMLALLAYDSESAAELGRRVGLRYVVTGTLARLGVVVASVSIIDTETGTITATASLDADEVGDIVSQLEEIALILEMSPRDREKYRGEHLAQTVMRGAAALYDPVADEIAPRLQPMGAEAMRALGVAAQTGIGVPADLAWATEFYKMAADDGSSGAIDNLVALSDAAATQPLRSTTIGGDERIQDAVADGASGRFTWRGQSFASVDDIATSLTNPAAIVELGDRLRRGLGVPQDPARARSCYERAAYLGFAPAYVRLAEMFERGEGGDRDPVRATQLREQAAEISAVAARAARALPPGTEVVQDAPTAAALAESDNRVGALRNRGVRRPGAQQEMGTMRRLADKFAAQRTAGADRMAISYYRRAAEAGDIGAMVILGNWLIEGRGVSAPDADAGIALLRRAAEAGSDVARKRLDLIDAAE